MQVSAKAEYAVRAMIELASGENEAGAGATRSSPARGSRVRGASLTTDPEAWVSQ